MKKKYYKSLAAFFEGEDITQEQLADALGISQSFMSMIVSRKRQPKLPLALDIHERTGVPLESLLKNEDEVPA